MSQLDFFEPSETEAVDLVSQSENDHKKQTHTKKRNYILLEDWHEMTESERQSVIRHLPQSNSTFNRQKTNSIEWALWSWNPVTGCLHGCEYCYARDIANRFYEYKFAPAFVPGRLLAPCNTRVPKAAQYNIGEKNVFVCSMADLFGKWVPTEWIKAVLEQVEHNPQWNFLFLTKFPARMAEFSFPNNAWVGTTVDRQHTVKRAEKAFHKIQAAVKWLSCEPMMERLTFTSLEMFDWVVIGGASKSIQTPEFRPPREWVNHLEEQAQIVGCKIYEKANLLERIKEYPGQ